MAHPPVPPGPAPAEVRRPSSRLFLTGLALLAAGGLVASVTGLAGLESESTACRWVALAGALLVGLDRRSLTTWIMVSMLLGAEIGYDFPEVGVGLRLFSQIFLKLI